MNILESTANRHIYPRELLKKVFDEKMKSKTLFIQENISNGFYCDISKIIGLVTDYKIKKSGEIIVDTKNINSNLLSLLKDLNFVLTMSGIGTVNEETKIINEDFKLLYLYIYI